MRKQSNRGREDKIRGKKKEEEPHPAKQTKTVETISTGSQKTVSTGLSTGSLEKGQQKEKSSKEPITIVDTPATQKERSPSNSSITYERVSLKTSTWREIMKMLDTKASLQDAETVLQEVENSLGKEAHAVGRSKEKSMVS